MLVLGGGGYTIKNVARCWYEKLLEYYFTCIVQSNSAVLNLVKCGLV